MAKDVYLIRHGQSTFNLLFEASGVDPLHFDARLSELGIRQAAKARQTAASLSVDLVVASPLTRALETALGLFIDTPVPIIVSSIHRERLGNSCDVGRPPSVLLQEFPTLKFDHLENTWWYNGNKDDRGVPVEPDHLFMRRVKEFSHWVKYLPEQSVAIVGHGTFFHRLTGRHLDNCEIMQWTV
jgi:broad specificity phosphatase PhoE